jgi:hypothetical protein
MRIRTSIITVVAAMALAVPAVAASATAAHRYVQPVVVSTVYPGTSSISGGCTMTLVAGHVSSFRCPGSTFTTNRQSCTLTVATGRLWTYSCPGGVQGVSVGAIPGTCRATLVTGYLWMYSCPKSAFSGTSTATQAAATKQAGAGEITSHRCLPPLTDGYLMRHGCIL